jgi:predicted secreted protein
MPLARAFVDREWGRPNGLVLLIALNACWSGPVRAQPAEPQATVLHLSQTAERKVTADLLQVDLRVEETGVDPLAVQAAINRQMTAALARARQTQGIEIETGSYTVNEEQPPHGPSRWRGSQSLILEGKDATAVLKLAGALQAMGLLMSSMSYEVSPETVRGAETALTKEALAGLDRRATAVADELHLSVLRYRDLQVGNAETGEPPMPRFAAMATAMPAPVAAPGKAVTRVTVTADLLLGQRHQ